MSWIRQNIEEDFASWLFTIKVKLPERSLFVHDIRPDISIDYDRLEDQLCEVNEMIAFWSLLLAEQRSEVMTLEVRRDVIKGELIREMNQEASSSGVRLNAQDKKDIVNCDDQMMRIGAEIINAQKIEMRLRTVVDNLNKKSDNLRSLAGFKREEKRKA